MPLVKWMCSMRPWLLGLCVCLAWLALQAPLAAQAQRKRKPTSKSTKTSTKPAAKPGTTKAGTSTTKPTTKASPTAPPAAAPALPSYGVIRQENAKALRDMLLREMPQYAELLQNPKRYNLQIIYTQVTRDEKNRPSLRHFTLGLDTLHYYFPASMVKLPTAVVALEKLNELKKRYPDLDVYSRMQVGAAGGCQLPDNSGSSLADYLHAALVVSDNIAFDRLYEFCGQDYLNRRLWQLGMPTARVLHRLGTLCTPEDNRVTNPILFYNGDSLLFTQPVQRNESAWHVQVNDLMQAAGYVGLNGTVVREPYDFSERNFISLKDLHETMCKLMTPTAYPSSMRFKIRPSDYKLLHRSMSMYPYESRKPVVDTSFYHPTRMKYLYYGANDKTPNPNLRIFNKVGMAVGFVTDCAYFVDFKNKLEFFVSATLYVNQDGILLDDVYEYDTVALPFLRDLGRTLYAYELKRKRKGLPNLSFYQHDYTGTPALRH